MQARIIALQIMATSMFFACAIACSSNSAPTADPVLAAKNREKVCSWVKELGYETRFDRLVRIWDPDLSTLAKRVNAEFEDADSTTDLLTRTAILFGKTRQRAGNERSIWAIPAAFWRAGEFSYDILGIDCGLADKLFTTADVAPACTVWQRFRSGDLDQSELVDQFLTSLNDNPEHPDDYSDRLNSIMIILYAFTTLEDEIPRDRFLVNPKRDEELTRFGLETTIALGDDECGLTP